MAPVHLIFFFYFHREVKWCVHRGDAQLSRAHTQVWMAVHVECVMAATFMDEPVSTANDSPILPTTVSSALVWYYHAHILICIIIDLIPKSCQDYTLTGAS